MNHADKTKAAYHVMQGLDVSLYDLELWGIVESKEDELTCTPEEAFNRLIDDGFTLGESGYMEHYYQATADYVSDALSERDLLADEFDDEPDVLEQAKAVERGDLPSGSVIVKVTGTNSLHHPGE